MAIFGLLLYAANTLRVTIARFHWAMRFLSYISASELSAQQRMPPGVRSELIAWAKVAAENEPVAVWQEESVDFTIYTDASETGWGAVSVSRNGSVLQLSEPWSERDVAAYDLQSSVQAEPLAIVRAVQALVPSHAKEVVIFTDHMPFVYAFQRLSEHVRPRLVLLHGRAVFKGKANLLRGPFYPGRYQPRRCSQPRQTPSTRSRSTGPHSYVCCWPARCRRGVGEWVDGVVARAAWSRWWIFRQVDVASCHPPLVDVSYLREQVASTFIFLGLTMGM